MPDRGKVINGLEWILNDIKEYGHYQVDNYENYIREALALLKGREPVPPIPYQQETSIGFFAGFKCGDCNAVVFPDYRFCPLCGRAVKWDD